MPDFTVSRRGTDSSGRGIFATAYMWAWWLRVLAHPDIAPFAFKIVIVQGAFMLRAGGGAVDSAGYHNGAGTFDLRVWNLTDAEIRTLVRVLREMGAAAWLRNMAHGGFKDPHIHFVLGTDSPLSVGAASQWEDYKAGFDGLSDDGPDYHPRPHPLVLTPPEDDVPYSDWPQADKDALVGDITAALKPLIEGNKLDVGKPAKWSDDTVAKVMLAQIAEIKAAVSKP